MNIFKVLKNFYGFPWQLRTLVCSRVEGTHQPLEKCKQWDEGDRMVTPALTT